MSSTNTTTQHHPYVSVYAHYQQMHPETASKDVNRPLTQDELDYLFDNIKFNTATRFTLFGEGDETFIRRSLTEMNEKSPTARRLLKQIPYGLTIDTTQRLDGRIGEVNYEEDPNTIRLERDLIRDPQAQRLITTTVLHEIGHTQEFNQIQTFGTDAQLQGFGYNSETSLSIDPNQYGLNFDQAIICDKLSEAEKFAQDQQIDAEMGRGSPEYVAMWHKNREEITKRFESQNPNGLTQEQKDLIELEAAKKTMGQTIALFMGSMKETQKHVSESDIKTYLELKQKASEAAKQGNMELAEKYTLQRNLFQRDHFYLDLLISQNDYNKQAINNTTSLNNPNTAGNPTAMRTIGRAFAQKYGNYVPAEAFITTYPIENLPGELNSLNLISSRAQYAHFQDMTNNYIENPTSENHPNIIRQQSTGIDISGGAHLDENMSINGTQSSGMRKTLRDNSKPNQQTAPLAHDGVTR